MGSTAGALILCYATKGCLPFWAWLCALLRLCWGAARVVWCAPLAALHCGPEHIKAC